MGTCLRWKKKNSYTVVQFDEEYSAAAGKYNQHNEQRQANRLATASLAASQWAHETGNDVVIKNGAKTPTNGFQTPTSDPESRSSPNTTPYEILSSTDTETFRKSQKDNETFHESQKAIVDVEQNTFVPAVVTGGKKVQQNSDLINDRLEFNRKESDPSISDSPKQSRDDSPARYNDVCVPNRASSSSSESEDEREDIFAVREQYFADKMEREKNAASSDVIVKTETHEFMSHYGNLDAPNLDSPEKYGERAQTSDIIQEVSPDPLDLVYPKHNDILHDHDEILMTDSPAGTWDARLNKDVRAHLDEVQRSGSNSKHSSLASMEDRDVLSDALPPARSRDSSIVQRVQFAVPDSDEEGEVTAEHASVSSDPEDSSELNLEDDNFQITSYQTYEISQRRDSDDDDDNYDDDGRIESVYDIAGGSGNRKFVLTGDEICVSFEATPPPRRNSNDSDIVFN